MSVPTSGWTARNGIIYNDYLVPDMIGALVPDNGSLNWRFLTQALASSTYTFIGTLRLQPTEGADSVTCGFYLYDGTKVIGFEFLSQSNGSGGSHRLRVEWMNSVTSDNSTKAGATINLSPKLFTAKIVQDVTNRTFYYYTAGGFTQFYQEAANSHMTEAHIGFGGVSVVNNTVYSVHLELIDWSVT